MVPNQAKNGAGSPIPEIEWLNRRAPVILGLAILFAGILTMFLGRGTTFTGDEMTWIIASPGMDLSTAFQTHGGHLQVVPRGLYKVMLEIFGLEYWPYRLLTVITVSASAVVLFQFLRRRVDAAVALIPCFIMLVFGSDPLHAIRGNGFTIVFSVLCGVAALLLIERRDLKGDLAACVLLILGCGTYTVVLPFVAGCGLALLFARAWKRLWVAAVPLALYGIWKIWSHFADADFSDSSGVDLANVVDIPRWCFDALSAVLSTLTGFGYGFTDVSVNGPDDLIGPALAVIAVVAIVWRLVRGSFSPGIWVALLIAVCLWSIQCLAASPDIASLRTPADPRYMYPGAVAVILIGAELVAGWRWTRPAFVALVLIGLFGAASNVAQMREYGAIYRNESAMMIRNITAASVQADELEGRHVETSDSVVTRDVGVLVAVMGQRPYGGISLSEEEILSLPDNERQEIDRLLAAYQLELEGPDPLRSPPVKVTCADPIRSGAPATDLPSGEIVLRAPRKGGELLAGRFADEPTVDLGRIPAGQARFLDLPEPIDGDPWRVTFDGGPLEICSGR